MQRRGREKCVQPCWTPRLRTRAALHDKPREIVRHSLHLLHLHHHFHHHDPNTSISASHDHPSSPSRSITASLVLPPPSLPPSLSAGGLIFLLPSWILTPLDYNAHIPCPSAFSHTHPLPTFFSHTLFLPLLSNTHIPSFLHLAVLCLVSHTHPLPSPLTRSSSVGATRTSLALHTSQRALSRVCADGHSPNLTPSPKHYSCLSIETLAFYTKGRHTIHDHSFVPLSCR